MNIQKDQAEEKKEYIFDTMKKKVKVKNAKMFELEEYGWEDTYDKYGLYRKL